MVGHALTNYAPRSLVTYDIAGYTGYRTTMQTAQKLKQNIKETEEKVNREFELIWESGRTHLPKIFTFNCYLHVAYSCEPFAIYWR